MRIPAIEEREHMEDAKDLDLFEKLMDTMLGSCLVVEGEGPYWHDLEMLVEGWPIKFWPAMVPVHVR